MTDARAKLVLPSGAPIFGGINNVGPGQGAQITFTESADIAFPGGLIGRFVPGVYYLMHEEDFKRMFGGNPGPVDADA